MTTDKPPLRVGATYSFKRKLVRLLELDGIIAKVEYLTGKNKGSVEKVTTYSLDWAARTATARTNP